MSLLPRYVAPTRNVTKLHRNVTFDLEMSQSCIEMSHQVDQKCHTTLPRDLTHWSSRGEKLEKIPYTLLRNPKTNPENPKNPKKIPKIPKIQWKSKKSKRNPKNPPKNPKNPNKTPKIPKIDKRSQASQNNPNNPKNPQNIQNNPKNPNYNPKNPNNSKLRMPHGQLQKS